MEVIFLFWISEKWKIENEMAKNLIELSEGFLKTTFFGLLAEKYIPATLSFTLLYFTLRYVNLLQPWHELTYTHKRPIKVYP